MWLWVLMLIIAFPLAFLAGRAMAHDYLSKLSDRKDNRNG